MGWEAAATLLPLSGPPMSLSPATGCCPQTAWSWSGTSAGQVSTQHGSGLGPSIPPHSLGCWLSLGGCSTTTTIADPPSPQQPKI